MKKREREKWTCAGVLAEFQKLGEPRYVEGMARFGIRAKKAYGVPTPDLHRLARRIGKDHELALNLWRTEVHDARILAGMIGEPHKVTLAQMETWVRDFDSWDICDGTCCHLYAFAAPAWKKAVLWSKRKAEFERRAGYALMAYLAVHDKTAKDAAFLQLLSLIESGADDDRNFVRKAVNWALRQIGKRNLRLNRAAIGTAEKIQKQESRSARWIAADALRELKSEAVQKRMRKKSETQAQTK